ncbi:MAG: NnrU family protein [Pseudomonadota bacterium]
MLQLIIGLAIFLGMHSIAIVAPQGRDRLFAQFGPLGWRAIYSIVSIAGFVLIVHGYAVARLSPTMIWQPPAFMSHITALLMLPVFIFLVAAYMPGKIQSALKHPMLVAVKLWALAHLLANGMLADIILFGSFLAWAVVDRISLKRRTQKAMVSMPVTGANDIIAIIVGIGLYVAFVLHLHVALIGVRPIG